MINRVILLGRLGRDPEMRRLDSGVAVAKFSIATGESYKDKEGNWQEKTEWHEIVAWRFFAEKAESSLKKGSLVYLEGKLTHRKYQDQEGKDRYRTEVVASYFRVIPTGSSGGGSGYFPTEEDPSSVASTNPDTSTSGTPDQESGTGSDDLPF